MDRRAAPPVTIEGGPGWQLDGQPVDAVESEPDRAPRSSRRSWPGLAVALLVGFVAGALSTDVRTAVLEGSDADALSLEATVVADQEALGLVQTASGQAANAVAVELENTGPRAVGLEAVELPGTGWRAEHASGRRVPAGGSTRVTLVRPVDCTALPDDVDAAPPLLVRALTDGGPRELRVRTDLDAVQLTSEPARSACGQVPASSALVVWQTGTALEGTTARLEVLLANASAGPVRVSGARVPAGLSVRLLAPDGSAVPLPLELPAGDYSRPRERDLGALPTTAVVAELSVADCDELTDREQTYTGGTLVELEVSARDDVGSTFFGNRYPVLPRLRSAVCAPR